MGAVWGRFLGWGSAFCENVLVLQFHVMLSDQDGRLRKMFILGHKLQGIDAERSGAASSGVFCPS